MKISKKLRVFSLFGIMSLVLVSCLSPLSEETQEWTDESNVFDSKIYVKSRVDSPWSTTRSSDEAVPLPINYYLFDTEGNCIDVKVINESGVKAEFSTSKGDYTIYAICGDSPDVPTKENVNLTDFYQLSADTDICMGKGSVSIAEYGSVNEVQISVNHIFSKIKLALSGVPSTVTSIKATFSSLYESVLLNGEYEGTQNVVKNLVRDSADPSQWILAESYIYPNASTVLSVSLTVTSDDGSVQEISTTTTHILSRGVRVSLTSGFRGLSQIEVGAVVENGWEDSSDELNFWGNAESGTNNEPSNNSAPSDNSTPEDNPDNSGMTIQSATKQPSYEVREYQPGEVFGNSNIVVYSCQANSNGGYDLVLVGLKPLFSKASNVSIDLLADYNSQVNLDVDQSAISWRFPTTTENYLLYDLKFASSTVEQMYLENSIDTNNICVCSFSGEKIEYYKIGTYDSADTKSTTIVWIIPFANYTI